MSILLTTITEAIKLHLLTTSFLLILDINQLSTLDLFFRIITEFGSEYFYIIVIPPIYWCISKKFGFRLLLLTSIAANITTVCKNLMKVARPPPRLWKAPPESFSFPSGHAHGSTSFWLYIMINYKKIILIVLGFVMIVFIALSRIQLGIHYYEDVYIGIALGVVTVIGFIIIDRKLTPVIRRWSLRRKLIMGIIPPVLLFMYSALFFNTDPTGVKLAGALLGIIVGYILQEEYLKFSVNVPLKIKIQRILLGLFISYFTYFGLGMVIPFNLGTCYLTSCLGGLSVMYFAPWLFLKHENNRWFR